MFLIKKVSSSSLFVVPKDFIVYFLPNAPNGASRNYFLHCCDLWLPSNPIVTKESTVLLGMTQAKSLHSALAILEWSKRWSINQWFTHATPINQWFTHATPPLCMWSSLNSLHPLPIDGVVYFMVLQHVLRN